MRVLLSEVVRRARQRYTKLDKQIAEDIYQKRSDVKCKRGCGGCCSQLVSCTMIEAFVIADHLIRNRDPAWIETLLLELDSRVAVMGDMKEMDLRLYLEKRKPCVFFVQTGDDVWDGECGIYFSRPLACRLEFVVSDPRSCLPDGVHEVIRIDTRKVQVQLTEEICGRDPMLGSYGPMVVYLAEALRCCCAGRQPSRALLTKWMHRLGDMLENDGEILKMHRIEEKYIK